MNNPKDIKKWWQGGSLYQIYPRSFKDTTGNGVGDINGIIENLDYVQSLQVSGIWLGPIFSSPMVDFGYDVSDYYKIDPMFGTMNDFAKLQQECQKRNLKLLLDLAINHTSNQHPWFQESVSDPDGDFGSYYVWADAQKDGTPPNNWLSVFGGSAWTWCDLRKQYYLHNFLKEQPDLNYHNPKIQNEVMRLIEFWLDKGVDGFRLDACNCYFHSPCLSDNPISHNQVTDVQDDSNPYFELVHLFDKSQPENKIFLEKVRKLVDQYPSKLLIGEIFCDREEQTTMQYTYDGHPLHSAYNFSLLTNHRKPGAFKENVSKYFSISTNTTWCLSNHDVTRIVSRWPYQHNSQDAAKSYLNLLAGLPGISIFYQGEELGLTEAEIPQGERLDPFGFNISSPYKGRDGCRTPMPWRAEMPHCGFSEGEPWLPVPSEHQGLSVNLQEEDKRSTLNHTRELLSLRKSNQAILHGDVQFWRDDEEVLAYSRKHMGQGCLFISSFSENSCLFESLSHMKILESLSQGLSIDEDGRLHVQAWGYGVLLWEDLL